MAGGPDNLRSDLPRAHTVAIQRRAWLDRYRNGESLLEIAQSASAHYETVRRYIRSKTNDAMELARLDGLSRTRALSEAESIMLERLLWRVDKKSACRASYGSNKELARAGIKRRWI